MAGPRGRRHRIHVLLPVEPGGAPRGRPTQAVGQQLWHARIACDAAIALADDVRLLGEWLRYDVLPVAGPGHADRCALYDFVLEELRARVPSCPHRLGPIYRLLKNR